MSQVLGKRQSGSRSGRTLNLIKELSTRNDHSQSEIGTVLDYVLASVNEDERPYLTISIFGVDFLGLLDSGASRTVLGSKGYALFKRFNLTLQPSDVLTCNVANGQSCPVVGAYTVPVTVEGKMVVINMLVMPSLPHAIILGTDFWRKVGIVPNIRNGSWHFTDAPEVNLLTITHSNALDAKQSEELHNLIVDLFSEVPSELGCTSLTEHVIKTKAEPIKQRFYPISPALQKHVNAQLNDMLEQGIVEPSTSPWASPIVMVKKKDGSYRFCVDYRKLNYVTERDAYPLPLVSNTLDKLRDARYLSSLDIKSAYWQIKMADDSKPLTAFTVPGRGLFQFCRMPFGLHNAPARWQRLIDGVLGLDLEPYVFVYLDDIIIVTQTYEKHIEVLKEVFHRLNQAGLTVGKDKCQFCRSQLKYLGYVVDGNGLHVDPEKVSAILNIPDPKNVADVRRVLGMAGWYRRFIPNFSTLVAPITNLLRKHTKFEWSETCKSAFEILKQHLVSAPVMSCPDFDRPFVIQTDASDFGLGAVLTQSFPDGERVISFISRSLNASERKFSVTEKECLSVLWSIEKFRQYVEATHFTVVTDHFALLWLHNLKDPSGRLARWSVRLQQYDFDVVHRRGKENVVPDALSRAVPVVNEVIEQPSIFPDHGDAWYSNMMEKIKKHPAQYPLWRTDGNTIFKKSSNRYPGLEDPLFDWKTVVPKKYRRKIITDLHDTPTCGHAGVHKTLHRISNKYYWPRMQADIATYIRKCTVCLAHKPENRAPAGYISGRAEITRPWELLSVDIVGPLPKSTQGNIYILSVQDYFSKYCLFFPMRTATASKIVQLLEDNVFLMFGVPRILLSDNGKQFVSKELKALTHTYNIQHITTAYYHPQANACERQHGTLKIMLSSFVADNHRRWDTLLPKVACAMRTGVNESTGLTPFFINFGREIILNGQNHIPPEVTDDPTVEQNNLCPGERSEILRTVFKDVRARLNKAQQSSAKRYNLRRRHVQYNVGDLVWRKNYVTSDAARYFTAKLAPKFIGPFVISKKISPYIYELKNSRGKSLGSWHVKDLKPDTSSIQYDSGEE